MDSACPAASRIAGQTSFDSGMLFTITAMARTFNFGKRSLPVLSTLGVIGRATDERGLRPYRRLADGDGR
jgi:hypothetical protein